MMKGFLEEFGQGMVFGALVGLLGILFYVLIMAGIVLNDLHNQKLKVPTVTCEVK